MASCITSRWVASAPQMQLTVEQQSSTGSSTTLSWTLEYIAVSPARTGGGNAWKVYINGEQVESGSYNINGKNGTYTVASGTTTVNKGSNKTSISFSVDVTWGLTWSGVYCGGKTAEGSIVIEQDSSGSSSGSGSGSSSSDVKKYTVKKGDTLTSIARKFNTTVAKLVDLNNITDPDYIVVGQVLIVSGTPSTPADETAKTKAKITVFGLQSNTDRTVYATWTWSREHTENYKTMWCYDTGDDVWFVGNDSTTEYKQSTYTAPENAKRVRLRVRPISKKRTVNDKETAYWTADWSDAKYYSFSSNPPKKPGAPTVTIDKYKLTAELDDLDVNATNIQFQVVKNHTRVVKTGSAKITTNHAAFSCTVDAGGEYKVRCRSYKGNDYSDWSEYSDSVTTIPSTPTGIKTIKATSETSVYLEWKSADTADSYELEYTTKKNYFDGSDQTTTIPNIEYTHYEKTGLESGEEYFFRVRALNDKGHSAWSDIKSVIIGEPPAAPTTWSSTTTVIVGEPLILYWVHNSEDGSSQTYAELEVYVNGVKQGIDIIKNSQDEDEKDKTSSYSINTSKYGEGAKIQWRVRTAGITNKLGDWSVQRTIDVYAPATLSLQVTDISGNALETLTEFPFYISAIAGPATQLPIGYHLTVVSNEIYETVDQVGNTVMVNKGEQVYSKYFDISDPLTVEMSANNISLEKDVSYTVNCKVTMDTGLNAEGSVDFTVIWEGRKYLTDAEISIDPDTYSAFIRPYCEDEYGALVDKVFLSVYRREFDGTFTELATNLDNTRSTFITDPHPALDYARYRIVAVEKPSGTVSFYDPPGYPTGCKAAIIQWSEAWSTFDSNNEDGMDQPAWSGSLLKLPYNIDVSDDHKPDVELVEYIGRSHPVSYYGTQRGSTSTWNMDIRKDDEETLYTLRRLANWMGDVYVREPSGSGYWANVSVSFSLKHCATTIPVTLNIVRVEGGA